MMIDAMFYVGRYDKKYENMALKSIEKLTKLAYRDFKLYHFEEVEAFFDDYAFFATALLSAFRSNNDEIYLIEAQKIINEALEKFYKNGFWSFSTTKYNTEAKAKDEIYTSAIGVMVKALKEISKYLKDEKYSHFASKTIQYNSYNTIRETLPHATLMIEYF